jgi:hypothetical protein
MPKILTSWKEIGQYLGKGVRTVQRWEREAGLPVHRQSRSSRYPVIALLDELDAWARSRTRAPSSALAGALQRERLHPCTPATANSRPGWTGWRPPFLLCPQPGCRTSAT